MAADRPLRPLQIWHTSRDHEFGGVLVRDAVFGGGVSYTLGRFVECNSRTLQQDARHAREIVKLIDRLHITAPVGASAESVEDRLRCLQALCDRR